MTDEELDEAEKQINEIRRNWLFHLFKKRLSGRSTTVAADEGELERRAWRMVEDTLSLLGRYRIPEERREVYRTIGGAPHLDGSLTVFGEVVDRVRRDRQNGSRGDRSERPARARSGDPVDQGVSEVGRFRSVRRAGRPKDAEGGLPVSACVPCLRARWRSGRFQQTGQKGEVAGSRLVRIGYGRRSEISKAGKTYPPFAMPVPIAIYSSLSSATSLSMIPSSSLISSSPKKSLSSSSST